MNDDLIMHMTAVFNHIKRRLENPTYMQMERVYFVSEEVWKAYENGAITDAELPLFAFDSVDVIKGDNDE